MCQPGAPRISSSISQPIACDTRFFAEKNVVDCFARKLFPDESKYIHRSGDRAVLEVCGVMSTKIKITLPDSREQSIVIVARHLYYLHGIVINQRHIATCVRVRLAFLFFLLTFLDDSFGFSIVSL